MNHVDAERKASIAEEIKDKAKNATLMSEISIHPDDLTYLRENITRVIIGGFTDNEEGKILAAYMMVDVGIRKYDRGGYWPYLEDECEAYLDDKDKRSLISSFGDALDILGLKHGANTKRYIEKVLMHSFVPERYLEGFYDFVSKVYEDILEYSIDDLDASFEYLAEYIRWSKQADGALESLDFPNPFSLRMCTRYALEDKEFFGPFLEKIIRIMDAVYKGSPYDDVSLNRYKESFDIWYSKNKATIAKRRRSFERTKTSRLIFNENSCKVSVSIPSQACSKGSQLIFFRGKEEFLPEQPQTIHNSKIGTKMLPHTYNLERLSLTPFDAFEIRLDGRIIFNNRRENVKLFKENGNSSRRLFKGHNFVLFATEGQEPVCIHDCEVESIGRRAFDVYMGEEGAVEILGETYLAQDEEFQENRISISAMDGVFAESANGELLQITNKEKVSFTLVTNEKNILPVVKLKRTGKEWVHIPIDRAKISKKDNVHLFGLEPEHISGSNGISEYRIILELDGKKQCERSFVLIPDFNFSFNKNGLYDVEEEGELNIFGLEREPIGFRTNIDHISHPLVIQNEPYSISYRVPAISVSVDDGKWLYPGSFGIKFDDIINDNLKIRIPGVTRMRLSMGKDSPELIERRDETLTFSIMGLKNKIRNNIGNDYELELSINSKSRKKFMKIITHNLYEVIVTDELMVKMVRRMDTLPTYVLETKEGPVEGQLSEGMNNISSKPKGFGKLSIYECKNTLLKEEDQNRLILKMDVGDKNYYIGTKDGCIVSYEGKQISIPMCNPSDPDNMARRIDDIRRLNRWITDKIAQDIMTLFE